MDAAVIDREAFTVADAEDVHGFPLALAGPVVVNIARADNHILALVNIHCAVTAFVDARVRDIKSRTALRLDADGAATVEPTGVNVDICTVFQFQNTA